MNKNFISDSFVRKFCSCRDSNTGPKACRNVVLPTELQLKTGFKVNISQKMVDISNLERLFSFFFQWFSISTNQSSQRECHFWGQWDLFTRLEEDKHGNESQLKNNGCGWWGVLKTLLKRDSWKKCRISKFKNAYQIGAIVNYSIEFNNMIEWSVAS